MEELYLNDSSDEDDEEFFDAVDAGEVEVVPELPMSPPLEPPKQQPVLEVEPVQDNRLEDLKKSWIGYEDPPRQRLALSDDDRPKISLWVGATLSIVYHSKLTHLYRVSSNL